MPKVSVIVPVYNAEAHLGQCMDSILEQTLDDIEVICVDDGSTDGSLAMLEAYRERDGRVRVLRQENQYAGVARNRGMEVASGNYLVFWDSDDYFKPGALETMCAKCEEDRADICVCGASRFYESLGEEVPVKSYVREELLPDEIPFSRETNKEHLLNFSNESVWNKMFLREFVEREGLHFQAVRNGNDVFFVACAMCLATRITVAPDCLVCYRTLQSTGLVGSLSKSPITPLQAWIDVRYELERRNALPRDSYVRKVAGSVFYLLSNTASWQSFEEAVTFLQQGGLKELLLDELEDADFYMRDWHRGFLDHLMSDAPADFLAYLSHLHYLQARTATAQRAKAHDTCVKMRARIDWLEQLLVRVRADRERILASRSYRLGHALTKPLRLVTKGK